MNFARAHRRLIANSLASVLLLTGAAGRAQAQAQPQDQPQPEQPQEQARATTFLDLEAGLGYSNNPNNQVSAQSSLFGRISASGGHQWISEQGFTSVHGYVENTTYFHGGYGSRQNFLVGANTNQAVSETVTLYGDVGFSGDFAGQLSNRLITVPSLPPPIDPNNPLPPNVNYPDVFGLTGRQYRSNVDVGASIKTGPRGTVSVTGGVSHSWFSGQDSEANYTSYFGSGGYSTQISERTSAGATVYLQRQDFRHGDWANSVNPTVTLSSQLSESVRASGSIGVIAINERTGGDNHHSVSPSFSGSLCNEGSVSRLCGHIARDAQTALSSSIVNAQSRAAITTTAGVDYFHRIGREGTIQASLTGAHYDTPSAVDGDKFRTTYLSAVVGYDRHIGSRMYAGIQGGTRKLFQTGPDPKMDFNASVYVRYRLGDLL